MSEELKCPACNRGLRADPWLPCEGGHYQDEYSYECDNCGVLPKDFINKLLTRTEDKQAEPVSGVFSYDLLKQQVMQLNTENAELKQQLLTAQALKLDRQNEAERCW